MVVPHQKALGTVQLLAARTPVASNEGDTWGCDRERRVPRSMQSAGGFLQHLVACRKV